MGASVYHPVSTQEISTAITAIQQQDQAVVGAFMERIRPQVFVYCKRYTSDNHQAEDWASDVITKLLSKLPLYKPERNSFNSWLHTVVHNHCINASMKVRIPTSSDAPEDNNPLIALPSREAAPDDAVLREEETLRVNKTLDILKKQNPTYWRCYVGTEVEGLSAKRVGEELHISTGDVYVRKCRAKRELAKIYRSLEENEQHSR